MTIKWMEHPKHGKYPCTSADVDLFKKAGWTEVVKAVEPPEPEEPEEPVFDPNAIVMSSEDDLMPDEPKPKPKHKSKAKK